MRAGKRSEHMLNLFSLEEQAQLAFLGAAVIADSGDVFDAFAGQRLAKIIRKASAPEAAEHDCCAIGNVRDSGIEIGLNFLIHRAPVKTRRWFTRTDC